VKNKVTNKVVTNTVRMEDSNIIFAIIDPTKFNAGDEDEDDNDEDYVPPVVTKQTPTKRKVINISVKNPRPVKNLNDLITVLENPGLPIRKSKRTKTRKNPEKPNDDTKELIESLKDLRDMVGLDKVKDKLVNQILLFIQKMNDPGMFLHTVLTGDPGVGKTTLCNILAKIYKNMGFLETDKVVVADRSQLIGKWLGETSIKTKEVLESAKGGILLIDEAYSLGNASGMDSYSKECIDCINQYLSEHAEELVCIIAGYKDDLDSCFFGQNQGLDRRFPWRYHLEQYKPNELYDIFNLQVTKDKWGLKVKKDDLLKLITENKELFKNNGGDTKNLLDKCKICHAQRVFGSRKKKKSLNLEDIKNGFKIFCDLRKTKKDNKPPLYMYL
jgi:SpoVK/Ycf46/Vps4 family AAA+-type ATPase